MDKWLGNANVVKLFALFLGVLLWAVVGFEDSATGTVTNPVREQTIQGVKIAPLYNQADYHLSRIEPENVTLVLRGRESALNRVSPADYQIQLDATRLGEGEHEGLVLRAVGFPSGVEVEITPRTAKVVLEGKEKKEIPIMVDVIGTAAEGYIVGAPVVKPARVHATVASSLIGEVEYARAEVVVDQAQSAVVRQVTLRAYNRHGQPMEAELSPQIVEVEVPITSPFKTIPLQVRISGQPERGFSVGSYKISASQVTAYGPQDVLDRLEFYEGLEIDLTGLRNDKYYAMDLPLLEGITHIEPRTVEIEIDIVASTSKLLENIPIMISGQNPRYVTTVVDPENGRMNLNVEGAASILNNVRPSDVQLIADVSNLPPGTHQVDLDLDLPRFVRRHAEQNIRVTIEIRAREEEAQPSGPAEPEDTPEEPPPPATP